jgi:hypothetical protein
LLEYNEVAFCRDLYGGRRIQLPPHHDQLARYDDIVANWLLTLGVHLRLGSDVNVRGTRDDTVPEIIAACFRTRLEHLVEHARGWASPASRLIGAKLGCLVWHPLPPILATFSGDRDGEMTAIARLVVVCFRGAPPPVPSLDTNMLVR